MTSFYDFTANDIKGNAVSMRSLEDKVVLIVNVASKCGFTPQYKGLEELYQQFKERGLVILAFPCNQFGSQEPGTADEITEFCQRNYGLSFPVMEKIEVNGDNTHPLYHFLKNQQKGILGTTSIKWNFTKFLVDRSGKVVDRYSPTTTPESIASAIQKLL